VSCAGSAARCIIYKWSYDPFTLLFEYDLYVPHRQSTAISLVLPPLCKNCHRLPVLPLADVFAVA
jgi:hypothetical protein